MIKPVLRIVGIVLVALLLLPTVGGAETQSDPVLATIGETDLRLSEFRDFLSARQQLQGRALTREGVRYAFNAFLDQRLFALEGPRIDIQPRDDETLDSDLFAFRVRTALVGSCPVPEPEEAAAFFAENRDLFATPTFVRVSRVVLPERLELEGVSAKAFLENEAKRISAGKQSLDALVSEVQSLDLRLPEIGDLGFVPLAVGARRTDPLERRLGDAAVNELVGPFAHEGMVFLLQVRDRREPIYADFESVEHQVVRRMMRQCHDDGLAVVREGLYDRYDVRLNEQVLSRLQPLGSVAPR